MPTPVTMLPPGYQPDLNRTPPSAVDARRIILLSGLLLMLVCGVGAFIVSQIQGGAAAASARLGTGTVELANVLPTDTLPPSLTPSDVPSGTPSPTETFAPTLDSWALTGTALFFSTSTATPTWTPTLDYCWWQTPSPTPSITPNQPTATLDDWSLQGTQIFIGTQTVTPTFPPTQQPPRALCDLSTPEPLFVLPTETLEDSPLFPRSFPTLDVPITPPATWTQPPPQIIYQPPPATSAPVPTEALFVLPTQPPQIIYVTVIVPSQPPQILIITATPLPATSTWTPTNTFTPTSTLTATHTATATNTLTWTPFPPTSTLTATLTDTPLPPSPTFTVTATDTLLPTATNTPTELPTVTPIPTDTPLPTFTPTALPILSISGNCDGGHLVFVITNQGGSLLETIEYRLINQLLLVESRGLFGNVPSFGTFIVDVGYPRSELWILGFDYQGQTIYSPQIQCLAPTLTPTEYIPPTEIPPPTDVPPTDVPPTQEEIPVGTDQPNP